MKSKILQASLGLAAALPLATAGAFTFANSAQAAALTGQFQISPGISSGGFSSAILSQNSLTFTPDPLAPNTRTPIGITPNSDPLLGGSFKSLGFNSALIGDIIQFTPVLNASNPFLDLGTLSPLPGVIFPSTDTTSVTDGQNVFILESASYSLIDQGVNDPNVTVAVALHGFFQDVVGGAISRGAGNLTFQIAGLEIAQLRSSLSLDNTMSDVDVVTSVLNSGGSFQTSFSGALFATVPEPATLLGLGLTGAAMFVSRRRKGQAVS